MRSARSLRLILASGILVTTACTAIIGTRDVSFDPNAEGGVGNGEGGPTNPPGTPPTNPPGSDGGPCVGDLTTDPLNCGRCGHDCLGGTCVAGECQPVEIATAIDGPTGIALTADKVYISSYGGKILVAPKDGKTQAQTIVTHRQSRGLFVEDPMIYWAIDDFTFDDGGSDFGGIYKCTIASCTPTLVTAADRPVFPRIVNNQIWFAAYGDGQIVKMDRTGANRAVVASTPGIYDFQVDGAFVYFTNQTNSLLRGSIADGGTTPIGPLNGDNWSFIAQDKDNIYWTFVIDNPSGGKTFSLPKANVTATPTSFGSPAENKSPFGIAVDDTNVYWVAAGTFNAGSVNNKDGALYYCPKAGCPATGPTTMATGLNFPFQLVVDDAIYVVELGGIAAGAVDGVVMKMAKP